MSTLFLRNKKWMAMLSVAILIVFSILIGTTSLNAAGITLTSSSNPSNFGQNVTFTWSNIACEAPVSREPSAFIVSFYDGNTLLGTARPSVGCNANASFSTAALAIGTHHISAGPDLQELVSLDQVVNGPRDVPEGDTLLLLGGGMSGVGVWLRYQWNKRRNKK